MKKLLSALFILGSVSMLANDSATVLPADEADPLFCVTNVCEVEQKVNVTFKVPKKLVVTVSDIDLGLWCGDADLVKTFNEKFSVKGEENEKVKVAFKNNSLVFSSLGAMPVMGEIKTTESSLLLNNSGEAKGGIEVKVNQPGVLNKLQSGKTYTAHATLVAAYDTSYFGTH